MSAKVETTRKEAVFWGVLYLIPVFIIAGVLAVDLYLNVQIWRYDYLTIQAKKNILRWVENRNDLKKQIRLRATKEGYAINPQGNNNKVGEISDISLFSKILKRMNPLIEKSEEMNIQEDDKKVENIEYGLQAMIAEIESLKVEKSRLENLQNLTRMGYQLGLMSPRPEQVVPITYSKDEREKLIQIASTEMPFPQKPKKEYKSPMETKYANEQRDLMQYLFTLFNKVENSFQEKFLNEFNKPVNAQPKVEMVNETNKGQLDENKNIRKPSNNGYSDGIDLDSLDEFLFEKL